MKEFLPLAYFIVNMAGLWIMWADKQKAVHHQYRISEKTLWLTAFFGGAVGTTIGMQLFRHKTKHLSFKIGFPFLAAVEIILFLWICFKVYLH